MKPSDGLEMDSYMPDWMNDLDFRVFIDCTLDDDEACEGCGDVF